MASHETKSCPRCNEAFECKPGNITQCQCYGLAFSDAEKEHIRSNYNDCLCRKCLDHIQHEIRTSAATNTMQKILSVFKK